MQQLDLLGSRSEARKDWSFIVSHWGSSEKVRIWDLGSCKSVMFMLALCFADVTTRSSPRPKDTAYVNAQAQAATARRIMC